MEIFLIITYHRQQSCVCFGEIMQCRQRCLGPPMLRDKLVVTGMEDLMLGYRDGRDTDNC
jgi:hypothetical protein